MKFNYVKCGNIVTMNIIKESRWLKYSYCTNKKYVSFDFYENGFKMTFSNQKRKNFCYRFDSNTTAHAFPNRVISMYQINDKMSCYQISKDCLFVKAEEKATVLFPTPIVKMRSTKKINLSDAYEFTAHLSYEGALSFRSIFPIEEIVGQYCVVNIINNGMKRIELIPATEKDICLYPNYEELKWEYGNVFQHCCADKVSFVRKIPRLFSIPQFFLKSCGIDKSEKNLITCYKKDDCIIIAPAEQKDFCTGRKITPANESYEELPICKECAKIQPLAFQKAYHLLDESSLKIAELKDKYEKIIKKNQDRKNEYEYKKAKEILEIIDNL